MNGSFIDVEYVKLKLYLYTKSITRNIEEEKRNQER